jgi:nitrogen regulatory protein PII
MKQIKAIVKPTRLELVLKALHDHLEVTGVSVSHVQGFGQKVGRKPSPDGTLLPFGTGDMCKVECIVNDEILDSVVDVIKCAAHTGTEGDGKIFVTPVEQEVVIKTGQSNDSDR